MSIAKTDRKKRVVLPAAKPGDLYDVQSHGDGRVVLVRLARLEPGPRMSKARCLEAIASAPLSTRLDWDPLKKITRKP